MRSLRFVLVFDRDRLDQFFIASEHGLGFVVNVLRYGLHSRYRTSAYSPGDPVSLDARQPLAIERHLQTGQFLLA
jgi:hypothetical protein